MSKKTPSLYFPNRDKDSFAIAKECLPAGKAVANPDNILRSALFEGKNHKIASVVRLHDRPLEFIKPQTVGKKAILSRRLCQILILASAEKRSFSLLHRISKKSNPGSTRPIIQDTLRCCIPRWTDVLNTNFLQVHHI